MSITSVSLRGEEFDVQYHDHGWEPDTNAHDIDWEFVDANAPQDLTDEEQDDIYRQLAEMEYSPFPDDVI